MDLLFLDPAAPQAARLARRAVGLAAAAVLAAHAAPPAADPTRPPTGMLAAPSPAEQPRAVAAAATPRAAASAAAPVAPPLVQSVQLPARGDATALVDGRLVKVGDRVGDAVVAAIDDAGLMLRAADGRRRLWLLDGVKRLPGAETRLADAAPAAAQTARAEARRASARPAADEDARAGTLALAGRTR